MKLLLSRKDIEEALTCFCNKKGIAVDPTKVSYTVSGQQATIDLDAEVETIEHTKEIAGAHNEMTGQDNTAESGEPFSVKNTPEVKSVVESKEETNTMAAPRGFGSS